MSLPSIRTEPGWLGGFTREQAIGALPNGTHVVKTRSEEGDHHPDGSRGMVLGSLVTMGELIYFVEWQASPHVAVAVMAWKLSAAPCRKCGGEMRAGQAMQSTITGDVTVSVGGPGVLIPCLKCKACGWSVTTGEQT